jgi:electron transport complex protein RnfC
MSNSTSANLIKVYNIPGGIHPPENKTQSMELPLAEVSLSSELVFPLSQHMGTPAIPIIHVGQKVLAGQKIADAVGALSVPVHASTSGTISAVEDRVLPHSSGMTGPCIVLASDSQHQFVDYQPCEDYRQLSSSVLIEKIREAGIAGLGGAGFPTAIKLDPRNTSIDTLILNGTECEPYITADDRLMQDYASDIIAGAELLAFILGEPKNIIIGIEDNKPDAINAMQSAAKGTRVQIVSFPTKYPSGGEKQLIQILTNKEVPSGKLPVMLGIVMQNVGTAMAAYRAVRFGEALTWRITTLVGEALKIQRNIKVLLGTPVEHLLDALGFKADLAPRLIMGGPMMGFALPDAYVPVVKTTNCIIAPSYNEMPEQPPAQECIRCGLCAEACPASLLPQQMYWYAKSEEYDRLQNHNLFDCIECGACSYVCPSTIPLVQYYRAAKGTIRQQQQEKIRSDHARQRFEFRQTRIELAEVEKEAKRLARKEAAVKAKALAAKKKADAAQNPTMNAATKDKPELDPVALAMAKVKEREQDPTVQQSKLERALTSAQGRVDKLQARLKNSESDQAEKLTAQVKQAQLRAQDAQKHLDVFNSTISKTIGGSVSSTANQEKTSRQQDNKRSEINNTTSITALKPAPLVATDAATAAIERAKVKTESMALMSPEEKLNDQLESLTKRVSKAREKLHKAELENSEHIAAFKTGLEKTQAKLITTQAELTRLQKENQ